VTEQTRHASSADRREDDSRLAFVYQEAVRGLVQQQQLVESFNSRAGNLIFATAFATSLLGGQALADGLGVWDWIGVALLLAIGALLCFMLWPYYNYTFRFDPEELIERYVDNPADVSLSTMHRTLALTIKSDMIGNWRIISRLRLALQLSLVLLLLEIIAWVVSIGHP
jgi:hypothetical protein